MDEKNKRTFSQREICDELGRTETTVSGWANKYGKYIPIIKDGIPKEYPYEALEIFKIISDMSSRGLYGESVISIIKPMCNEYYTKNTKINSVNVEQLDDKIEEIENEIEELTKKLKRYKRMKVDILEYIGEQAKLE